MTPAIVFQAKGNRGRYLANGPECVDWSNKHGDTAIFTDALFVYRRDYKPPTTKDLEDFYNFIANLPLSNDVEFIKENYIPVYVQLTDMQMAEVEERNEM